ncbi:MAG: cupin domain-containing protein [Actinomycetota bacterium]|nr:cupin domain-containing protein [Actinomycetota bacterium]
MQINLLDDDGWLERTWPPERPGFRWRRKRVAGDHLGASLYELPPGERTFPYHYELGNDELLVVVSGRPTLRDLDGERELRPGDCVLFPSGPGGAHQVVNLSTEPARVLFVSNLALPRSAVQPDSGKMMIRWGPGPDDRRWFRLADEADYWEGEAEAD